MNLMLAYNKGVQSLSPEEKRIGYGDITRPFPEQTYSLFGSRGVEIDSKSK